MSLQQKWSTHITAKVATVRPLLLMTFVPDSAPPTPMHQRRPAAYRSAARSVPPDSARAHTPRPFNGPFGNAPNVGSTLDRYHLVLRIACGGMGAVWLARDNAAPRGETLVALKTMLPLYAADERFRKMFLDEAHIAAKISHPNVASVLNVGESGETLFYAMEWVDGESLQNLHRACLARGEVIPLGVVLRLMADALLGLHAAHELRGADNALLDVVHRDVSPHNILISEAGIARIIDFGIAKARERLSEDTCAGNIKGKLEYLAPEQVTGASIDRRVDIWAAGAILYHIVTGHPVYAQDNEFRTINALLSRVPPEPVSAPAPIARVIMRALSIDAADRFATALEMSQALESAMTEARVVATHADVAAFAAKLLSASRKRRQSTMASALAVARARRPGAPQRPNTLPRVSLAPTSLACAVAPRLHERVLSAIAVLTAGALAAFVASSVIPAPAPVESQPSFESRVSIAASSVASAPSAAATAGAPRAEEPPADHEIHVGSAASSAPLPSVVKPPSPKTRATAPAPRAGSPGSPLPARSKTERQKSATKAAGVRRGF